MADRAKVYEAIRRAGAAGDGEAVKKLAGYLKTLPAEEEAPEVPAGPTDDERRAKIAAGEAEIAQLEQRQKDEQSITGQAAYTGAGVLDSLASLASGIVSGPLSGLAGIVASPADGFAGDTVRKVGAATTYQPRTPEGRAGVAAVSKPFEALANAGDRAGDVVNNATGSPALAAATNTAVQSIPALLLRKGKPAGAPSATQAIAEATARAQAYAKQRLGVPFEKLSSQTQQQLTTIAQDAQALNNLDPAAIARQARLESLPVPVPATRGAITRDPVALRNEGNVAPTSAGAPIREIQQAGNQALLDNLDVLKRKVTGTGKTAGKATTPEQTGGSVQGAARSKLELKKAQTKQLYDEADAAGETNVPVKPEGIAKIKALVEDPVTASNYGYAKQFLDGVLSRELPVSQAGKGFKIQPKILNTVGDDLSISAAMDKALSTRSVLATNAQRSTVKKFISEQLTKFNPNRSVESLNNIRSQIRSQATKLRSQKDPAMAELFDEADGVIGKVFESQLSKKDLAALTENDPKLGGQVTIKELETLRQEAVAKAKNGGEDAFRAGKLITAIDNATDGVGGALYQKARQSRREQALEFEEQGAVASLVDDASRTDRVTALENTTKTIVNGSLEDTRKIKRTLLTGGNAETRAAGREAWRDVRRQVLQDIKDEATKGVALNADGSPNLSVVALKRVLDKYGPEKLGEIFGPGTAKQLDKILSAARDIKTQPPSQIPGSTTLANVLTFLEKGLTKVPGGGVVADVVRGAAKVKDLGKNAREAQQAQLTPLREAADKAGRKVVIDSAKRKAQPLIPLSQMSEQEQ